MSDLSAEERAKANAERLMDNALGYFYDSTVADKMLTDKEFKILVQIETDELRDSFKEAEQAAEARMQERCCKAMCDLCREGDKPAYGEVGIHHDFYHYKEGSIFCRASAIRRGGRA